MASLLDKLTQEGGGEQAKFLNDIVAQLWPNINVAGSKMIQEIANPMFKTMLPGPLATLHFTKVDLGQVPMRLSNVLATKTETKGIKLDMDVDWDGQCDIDLDADYIPALGVKSVGLHGRLSTLLCPLTNVIPLIGAAQLAFINPPELTLDFTGAAEIADLSVIDGAVRKVILGIINSMLTLPNRFLLNLDVNNDYFATHLYPEGIIRIKVEKAYGFAEESKSSAKKFFSKLTRASPDCYANVEVGAEEAWKTATKNNTTSPVWNETHDFVVTDFDQIVKIAVEDQDLNGDDEVGTAVTTVKDILLAKTAQHELPLILKGAETGGKVALTCQFFEFTSTENSFAASDHKGDGLMCGLVTILVASARGIQGKREELSPSVVVSWGAKHKFQTAVVADAVGVDVNNPGFNQNFRVPVTPDMVGSGAEHFRIALMNKEKEVGAVEVPFADVLNAPEMTLQNKFAVGEGGATVRASICLKGVRAANV